MNGIPMLKPPDDHHDRLNKLPEHLRGDYAIKLNTLNKELSGYLEHLERQAKKLYDALAGIPTNDYDKAMFVLTRALGITNERLVERERSEPLIWHRFMYVGLLYEKHTLKNIGKHLGRHHSTIINCRERHIHFMETNNPISRNYQNIFRKVEKELKELSY